MKTARIALVCLVVASCVTLQAAGEEEAELIVMSHLGGHLAVNLEVVQTVFYLEKDGRQRLHVVWKGNPEGKSVEGSEAGEIWKTIRREWKSEFIWTSHMEGSLGITLDSVTSVFYMPAGDGKPAMLRINYGTEAKTVEGEEADALWKTIGR
jgi:hypothetical protein